jgi:hypothetical protein
VSILSKVVNFLSSSTDKIDDPYADIASIDGVHYNHAKITHKQAVRKMAEYGMSAKYNIHDKKWVVEYNRQMEVSESFREAVEAIKVD